MIVLQGITKHFPPNVTALRQVDLSIEAGESVAILGASGSGKTTLLDIIGTLSKPSEGTYTLLGNNSATFSARQLAWLRRSVFGYIFQSFNLIHDWPVKKNLDLALRYKGKLPRRKLQEALEGINLGEKLEAGVNTLSGGEQQRVAVLRTILRDPDIILADEPTGNLDAGNAELVMEMLFSLHRKGKTLLMITHNAELASRFARIIRLERGCIKEKP